MAQIMEKHLEIYSRRFKDLTTSEELSQSVLLIGPDGIGKFKLVMEIAGSLLCEKGTGCGICRSCKNVAILQHPDFLFVYPFPKIRPESKKHTLFSFSDPVSSSARYSEESKDEAENYIATRLEDPFAIVAFEKKENIPVEIIKDLLLALSKRPLLGGRRVVVIQNVDKMAFGAADLFLKIVEEPPANTHIILTTANPDQLQPTLLSRTSIMKIAPAPIDMLTEYLSDKLAIAKQEAEFLARMSKGSPGRAIYLHQGELAARRDKILIYFEKLTRRENLSLLAENISKDYVDSQFRFNDIRMDFEIMESIIHDLYMLEENRLENHLINVDIVSRLKELNRPAIESLDIWKGYCGEMKRACLVNNVSVSSAMLFFYISCEKAIDNPMAVNLKLP